MSRPKLVEQDKRIVQVNIRLTSTESSTINEQASATGLSPANWIRHKVFTGNFPPMRMSLLDTSTYQELRRIGVNVNQIAHKLNQGDYPKECLLVLIELKKLLEKTLTLLVHDSEHDQG